MAEVLSEGYVVWAPSDGFEDKNLHMASDVVKFWWTKLDSSIVD